MYRALMLRQSKFSTVTLRKKSGYINENLNMYVEMKKIYLQVINDKEIKVYFSNNK